MPILTDWKLSIDADDVLRLQGADPAAVRSRKPKLVEAAEWALQEGLPALAPAVLYGEFDVRERRHERLYLSGYDQPPDRLALEGRLLSNHLTGAERVLAALCTTGDALEAVIREWTNKDLVKALALEGVGSAAAEALAVTACNRFEAEAAAGGQKSTLPLSPGMIDWPVDKGQPQIFNLLQGEREAHPGFKLSLTSSFFMLPRKSVSFVLGLGADANKQGKPCDYCSVKETCRYQNHYA